MSSASTPELDRRDVRRRRSLVAQTTLALFGRTGALVGASWIGITALLGIWAPFLANSRPIVWQVKDEAGNWVTQYPLFQYLTPQDVMLLVGFLLIVGLAFCYRAGGKLFWVWSMPMAVTVVCSLIFHLIPEHRQLLVDYRNESTGLGGVVGWWVQWALIAASLLGLFVLGVFKLKKHVAWLVVGLLLSILIGGMLLTPQMRVKPQNYFGYDEIRAMIDSGDAKGALYTPIPYSPDDLQVDAPVKVSLLPPGPSPTEADVAADMVSYMENEFGLRLYALDQAEGIVTPSPVKTDEAFAAADRLWAVYAEQNKDDLEEAQTLNEQLRVTLAELAETGIGKRYHLMGTTSNGEDLTARMIHGSRIALYIGFISTGIAVFIGVVIGGLLGYFAGWTDMIGLRLVEIFASIPVIMLLIMIVAFYGRSLVLMMVVLGLTGWVGYAYFVRAEFLKLRKMDYVMAARASGTPLHLILFKHMLPNGVAPVLVGASFGIAGAIMTEATLSFLGLGLENEPSWGQMLNQARKGGSFSWWLAIYPGAAIFLTVFAYNLIGEALRDVIDPRTAK